MGDEKEIRGWTIRQSDDSYSNIFSVFRYTVRRSHTGSRQQQTQRTHSDVVAGNQTQFWPYCISVAKRCELLSSLCYKAFPRLKECCMQVEAEVVSNSGNKIHQTWERPCSEALYMTVIDGISVK